MSANLNPSLHEARLKVKNDRPFIINEGKSVLVESKFKVPKISSFTQEPFCEVASNIYASSSIGSILKESEGGNSGPLNGYIVALDYNATTLDVNDRGGEDVAVQAGAVESDFDMVVKAIPADNNKSSRLKRLGRQGWVAFDQIGAARSTLAEDRSSGGVRNRKRRRSRRQEIRREEKFGHGFGFGRGFWLTKKVRMLAYREKKKRDFSRFLLSSPGATGYLSIHWNVIIFLGVSPPTGWLKINLDGALRRSNVGGIGIVIQDDRGLLITTAGWEITHWDSTQFEQMAFRYIHKLVLDWMFEVDEVIIEGDNASVIQFMQDYKDKERWRTQTRDCIELDWLTQF
ncbi:hypothetical protein MA16_Dca027213 [Dendrobium catenatum]|uniref:RNase H type-1 domain-containing protein n=1 Tax=Dendrobium catenatum TaxID=906689 RepID=A0A2I0VF24_9ASPA|nr:hypothetical protein MA16_Dca027213 [Dendrobium catenatum]